MRVVVAGGAGVIGRQAVPALRAAGHQVRVLLRRPELEPPEELDGAELVVADLLDPASLENALADADAVVNLASQVPTGYGATQRSSWRHNDRLLTDGVDNLVSAALATGVRRVVQSSSSLVYADAGEEWITEQSALEITEATEPLAAAEAHVQDYACESRTGVVLRLGHVIGADPATLFGLRAAAHGRPVGVGVPEHWAHVVHQDDLGPAIVASLMASSGIYNVGAEPVTRREVADGFAVATGGHSGSFPGPLLRWLSGPRSEPLGRSLRVCSDHFTAQTGWSPRRPKFDTSWFDAARSAVGESAPVGAGSQR